jgi:hypothetical protein
MDGARRLAAGIADPPVGPAAIDVVARACDDAFESGCPAAALPALGAAVDQGVPHDAARKLQLLAAPLLGD